MRIASWNVNSISVRLKQIITWLSTYKPDVLCLQETKIVDEKFPKEAFNELGYRYEFCGEKAYNGVAILSNQELTNVFKNFADCEVTQPARFIEAKVGSVFVVNVYIPNGAYVGSEKYTYKLNWIQNLINHLKTRHQPDEPLVLCGDFNIAPEDIDVFSPEQVAGTILVSDLERNALAQVREWGFIDAFRLHHKDGGHYTWWDYQQGAFRRNMGFRIDHIWMTAPLVLKCTNSWIDKEPRKWERPSDHAPIVIELETNS